MKFYATIKKDALTQKRQCPIFMPLFVSGSINMEKKSQVYRTWKNPPPCGTKGGYDVHRRMYVEEPCDPCREAMKLYWVEMRRKRGPEMHKMRAKREAGNPHYKAAKERRARRTRARKAGVEHDGYNTQDVIDNFGTNCHICGGEIDLSASRRVGFGSWEYSLHIDHVIPIAKGGTDTLDNVRPAHAKCNIIKSDTILENLERL